MHSGSDEPNWSTCVKELRRRLSQTQQMLAFDLGVSRETISRWESGKDEPNISWQRRLAQILEKLEQQDSLQSLFDTVETTGGLATLLDSDFRILRTSPKHQELSTYDVTELYGRQSERYWSADMAQVIDTIGGLKGYRERRIRRLELKLEVIRKPGEPGFGGNRKLFTVGSTITWGPAHAPYAYLTQMRIEQGGDAMPPLIKTFGSTLKPLR